MTASLYQSASDTIAVSRPGAESFTSGVTEVVFFRAQRLAEAQHVRRIPVGVQFDVVARALPQIALSAQKVFHPIRMACVYAKLLKRHFDERGTRVVGIEVHGDHDYVRTR